METEALQPTKRAQAQYSNEFIANALAELKANRGNVSGTARQLGIPRLTLREWAINNRRDSPEVRETRQVKEGTLEQKWELIAHMCADRLLEPGVIEKASPLDLGKIGGIAIDKRQVLTGQPTSITSAILTEEERRFRLAELLVQAEARLAAARQSQPADPQPVALLQG